MANTSKSLNKAKVEVSKPQSFTHARDASRDFQSPPRYAPNAIATTSGWVDHQTGELLHATKYLNTELIYNRREILANLAAGKSVDGKSEKKVRRKTAKFDILLKEETGEQPFVVQAIPDVNIPSTGIKIHWGDGSDDQILADDKTPVEHTYPNVGQCTLTATATFEQYGTKTELVVKKLITIKAPKKTRKAKE